MRLEPRSRSADRFFPKNSDGQITDVLCLLPLVSTANEKEESTYPFLSSALQLSSTNDESPPEASGAAEEIKTTEEDPVTELDQAATRSAVVNSEETPSTAARTGDESDDEKEISETSVKAGE